MGGLKIPGTMMRPSPGPGEAGSIEVLPVRYCPALGLFRVRIFRGRPGCFDIHRSWVLARLLGRRYENFHLTIWFDPPLIRDWTMH